MKLTIQQDHLQTAIAQARRAVPGKAAIPVLTHLKLSATTALTVTATDLHIGITATQSVASIAERGETLVGADLFATFVQSLPDAQLVELETTSTNGHDRLDVRCGTIKATFNLLNADDFPVLPTPDDATRFTIHGALLSMLIEQVDHAAAKDDSRPVLAGVNLTVEGDRMTLAAADGFQLAATSGGLKTPAEAPISVIVPVKGLRELATLCRDLGNDITIAVTPAAAQIVAELPTVTWRSSLIEGSFPDFRQIVPRDFRTEVTCDRDALLSAIKRARGFSAGNNHLTRYTLTEDGITVEGISPEASSTESTIPATITGEGGATWALDGRFISDALGAVNRSTVWLGLNGGNQAIVIQPEKDAKQTHIIMPMVAGAN